MRDDRNGYRKTHERYNKKTTNDYHDRGRTEMRREVSVDQRSSSARSISTTYSRRSSGSRRSRRAHKRSSQGRNRSRTRSRSFSPPPRGKHDDSNRGSLSKSSTTKHVSWTYSLNTFLILHDYVAASNKIRAFCAGVEGDSHAASSFQQAFCHNSRYQPSTLASPPTESSRCVANSRDTL